MENTENEVRSLLKEIHGLKEEINKVETIVELMERDDSNIDLSKSISNARQSLSHSKERYSILVSLLPSTWERM